MNLQWSCLRQHISAFEAPPKSWYLSAVCPLPHHLVPGATNQSDKARFCLKKNNLQQKNNKNDINNIKMKNKMLSLKQKFGMKMN